MALYKTVMQLPDGTITAVSTPAAAPKVEWSTAGAVVRLNSPDIKVDRTLATIELSMSEAIDLAVGLLRKTGHPPDVVRQKVRDLLSKE
jgi:hypothetical protein